MKKLCPKCSRLKDEYEECPGCNLCAKCCKCPKEDDASDPICEGCGFAEDCCDCETDEWVGEDSEDGDER